MKIACMAHGDDLQIILHPGNNFYKFLIVRGSSTAIALAKQSNIDEDYQMSTSRKILKICTQ